MHKLTLLGMSISVPKNAVYSNGTARTIWQVFGTIFLKHCLYSLDAQSCFPQEDFRKMSP